MKKQHKLILSFAWTGCFLVTLLNISSLCASGDNDEEASKSFTMASIVSKDSPEGTWLYLTYTEAFSRLGLELVFQHYPSIRASKMADQHEVEGELARGYHYGANHPELVRVEEPGISNLTVALATDPNIKLDGWGNVLEGRSYQKQ